MVLPPRERVLILDLMTQVEIGRITPCNLDKQYSTQELRILCALTLLCTKVFVKANASVNSIRINATHFKLRECL